MRFRRVVSCSDGVRTYYFLVFDQPQVDERGEGPYIGAEIESSYVELLKSAERTPAPSEGQVAE